MCKKNKTLIIIFIFLLLTNMYKKNQMFNYEFVCVFFTTCGKSYFPLTHVIFTPGKSLHRPLRTNTTLCSWRLCPSPGTYAIISLPLLKRTRTHFRLAEFGFFGFRINVFKMTPFKNGLSPNGFRLNIGFLWGPVLCIWLSDAIHLVVSTTRKIVKVIQYTVTKFNPYISLVGGQKLLSHYLTYWP